MNIFEIMVVIMCGSSMILAGLLLFAVQRLGYVIKLLSMIYKKL